jgi:hypothetical protein
MGRDIRPFGGEIAQRLLTDPRMRTVWPVLLRAQGTPAALANWQRIDAVWQLSGERDSPQDKACGAFFAAALSALGMGPEIGVETSSERERGSAPYRVASLLCRHHAIHALRAQNDSEFARMLGVIGDYFEEQWRAYALADSPRLVERRKRGDHIRAAVCMLAAETHKLFGTYLYSTIATTVTVGLNINPALAGRKVRNWCDGLQRNNTAA